MAKKAVCVGINDYPGEGSDLRGCVNDAKAWAELLIEHFGFDRADVRLILDSKATKKNITEALENMIDKAVRGDIIVYCNSSHGTYLKDTDGDENEYDEAICPFDCDENLIVDDELRELFSKLADGVSLTVISDSCHSGSITRFAIMGKYRKPKFMNPALMGKGTLKNLRTAKVKRRTRYTQASMKEVLLSGSKDSQFSYDAEIEGNYHGAMTYYALQAIQNANYTITYTDLHKRLLKLLKAAKYPQEPQLEGKAKNKKKLIFT